MNSSGIKRGLAVSAISALAIAGIPQIAFADSIDAQTGAGTVELFTQYSGNASVQNDGVNTTVHLLAGGGPDITQVRFEYGPVATPTVIATVSRTNGVFSTEWAPPVALYGTNVAIRAVGLNAVGNPVGGAATDTATATVGANTPAIDIANAPGSTVGVFRQPYGVEEPEVNGTPFFGVDHNTQPAIVTGTTSGAGAVRLEDLSNQSRVFPATATPTPGAADANGVRSFRGTVNFQDYTLATGANAVNEAVAGASQAGGSDDAEVLNLRSQTITTVTAVATPASVPNNGATSTAVVTVQDQFGELLSGAQVIFDADNDGVWDTNESEGYTNASGQVSFPGLTGAAAPGTTYNFFVNTTDGNDFEPAVDFRRSVTVTSFAQVPTTLTSTSADGAAFDVNEYGAGDIVARLLDQNGAGVPNATVSYRIGFVPFTQTTPPTTFTPQVGSGTTDAEGRLTIPFTAQAVGGTYTLSTFVERDGTPGQTAGDLSGTDLTFKAGDSTLAFADAPTASRTAGTTATFNASLKLEDGTALAGRVVNFTYAPTGNSQLAAQANQPAGTTQTSANAATDTTDAAGVVSVAVTDPAAPPTAELNNALDADTANTPNIGNAAEDAVDLDIDFARAEAPANATVTISAIGTTRPGTPIAGTVTVTTPNALPGLPANGEVGQQVTLTLPAASGAFFTDNTFDPAPAVGADGGEFKSLGKSITITTGAGGVSPQFFVSIERDAGFDDDGLVEAIVTATAGATATSPADTEDVDFDSANPLNGGEVQLVLSPEDEQEGDTTPADTNQDVAYDVYVTDQFGNRVGGETVNLSAEGDDDDTDVFLPGTVVSDFDDDGDFTVTSDDEDDVTVTASWTTDTSKFVADGPDAGTVPDGPVAGTETLTDTASVTFADTVIDEAATTLTGTPETQASLNQAVTETLKVVDSNGDPVVNAPVTFTRSGAGGVETVERTTNANGVATYVFTSAVKGTTSITAEVTALGQTVSKADTVTFVDGGKRPIRVNTTGGQANGGRTDIIRIRVSSTGTPAGATATLFRKVGDRNVRVAVKRVGTNNRAEFRVRDRNGVNRLTSYFVVVGQTDDTLGRRGPVKKFR